MSHYFTCEEETHEENRIEEVGGKNILDKIKPWLCCIAGFAGPPYVHPSQIPRYHMSPPMDGAPDKDKVLVSPPGGPHPVEHGGKVSRMCVSLCLCLSLSPSHVLCVFLFV